MKFIPLFLTLFCPVWVYPQTDTIQHVIPDRVNSATQQSKPYVILISVDGLRYDFVKKYKATNLSRLSKSGVTANYLIPSYPTLTFPNHYSMVTGLYPAHHGLVDNTFYDSGHRQVYDMHNEEIVRDSSWYGGIPLWALAENLKMVTASFYWVASNASIQGVRPTFYYHFNEKIPTAQRVDAVKDWLELPDDRRPHLIMFYFPDVDHQAHDHGPDSQEVGKAIHRVDEAIGRMAAITDSLGLPVNYIIVSDHGMASVDTKSPLSVPSVLLDTTLCRVVGGSTLLHVYVKDKGKILATYHKLQKETGMQVYLPQDIPMKWHYGRVDDWLGRIGDIIIVARFPRVFKLGNKEITPGKHGFDPAMREMRATFLAWGPAFKKGLTVPAFENVNIFPLVARVLGLQFSFVIDGNKEEVVDALLKKK